MEVQEIVHQKNEFSYSKKNGRFNIMFDNQGPMMLLRSTSAIFDLRAANVLNDLSFKI